MTQDNVSFLRFKFVMKLIWDLFILVPLGVIVALIVSFFTALVTFLRCIVGHLFVLLGALFSKQYWSSLYQQFNDLGKEKENDSN